MIRVQTYLGKEIIADKWFDPNNEEDMMFLHFCKRDMESNMHPELKFIITGFSKEYEYTVVPQNPAKLEDIV